MGNDGGSIPTRRELVKDAAPNPSTAQVKEAQREVQHHFWTTCPLSHKPLSRPIVSDSGGNLYNKDAVLQFLLPGDNAEGISSKADCEEFLNGRIRGLRDVVELRLEVDNDTTTTTGSNSGTERHEAWICPITTKQLGPNVKSVYLVPCGHVFCEEAVRQLKGDRCLQCNEPYTEDNIITILPTQDTDKKRLVSRATKLAEQGLTHSLKKAPGSSSKKRKKHNANGNDTTQQQEQEESRPTQQTSTPTGTPAVSSGIKHAATAMLTARVLDEENEKKKRRKMMAGTNENLDTIFTKGSADGGKSAKKGPGADFMTRGYSIPASTRR